MGILTTVTRMWLSRSLIGFNFKNEYDNEISFSDIKNLGLYVHIPFCKNICLFCPYCKELYNKKRCETYIDYLIKEIHAVGNQYIGRKKVTSLYFGGGTPALAIERITEIIDAIQKYFIITEGIGLELHPIDVTIENLLKLKTAGVTKISIGIQSFQDKFLKTLGRSKTDYIEMFNALNAIKFETVSMDFIFALPGQRTEDLIADIETAFSNGANHIAIYPFIDFSFTDSKIQIMNKKAKRKLMDDITIYCQNKNYHRDSIWTFSNHKGAKYSSMTRDNFLGFGCSATTLLNDQFKINTFSVDEYQKRIDNNKLPTSLTIRFTLRQRMIYYLFWTAYTTKISSIDFEKFFGVSLQMAYGFELWLAKRLGLITEDNGVYHMTLKGAFYYHHYENYYTLSYIDKMWGIMKQEAFPKEIHL